jgi:hypothetical protein
MHPCTMQHIMSSMWICAAVVGATCVQPTCAHQRLRQGNLRELHKLKAMNKEGNNHSRSFSWLCPTNQNHRLPLDFYPCTPSVRDCPVPCSPTSRQGLCRALPRPTHGDHKV